MLNIRKEQMREMGLARMPAFGRQMLVHAREHFPVHLDQLGEQGFSRVVRHGHERAKEYGFTTRHEVCLFIDFSIMLGSGFDTDPQLPWVADILREDPPRDPTERIETLYDSTMDYLDEVVGEEHVFPVTALRKSLTYPFGDLENRLVGRIEQAIIDEFNKLWPRKHDHVGTRNLHELVRGGIERAGTYGLTAKRGAGLFLILMFLLGHRFDSDPQYPWLSAVLNDPQLENQAQKCDRLHSTYIEICSKALG